MTFISCLSLFGPSETSVTLDIHQRSRCRHQLRHQDNDGCRVPGIVVGSEVAGLYCISVPVRDRRSCPGSQARRRTGAVGRVFVVLSTQSCDQ